MDNIIIPVWARRFFARALFSAFTGCSKLGVIPCSSAKAFTEYYQMAKLSFVSMGMAMFTILALVWSILCFAARRFTFRGLALKMFSHTAQVIS